MIAMSISGVIFDLGSTLIHRTGLELEREKCAALAALARTEWGCRNAPGLAAHLLEIRLDGWRRSEEELVERLATESIARAFREAGLPTDETTLRRAERAFFEPEVRISRLYPGAVKTLDALRVMGLRLGMISNASSHQLILDITAKHGIGGYFDPLLTSAGFGRVKPHPSIFTQVLNAWERPVGSVVMVGDTLGADVLGAHTVGMRSILVDIEPNPANAAFAESARPTERVTSLEEIPSLLKRWATAP
ncbi:MAG TPA: HAD family hydrolase [bacterium]|nr:HAD family hydrolase [bacterium]